MTTRKTEKPHNWRNKEIMLEVFGIQLTARERDNFWLLARWQTILSEAFASLLSEGRLTLIRPNKWDAKRLCDRMTEIILAYHAGTETDDVKRAKSAWEMD